MTKVEKYTQEAINIANDNSHGYSQANRNGNPDYDCSSLVCNVVQRAGIPVMDRGASYTGNMYDAFLSCGFRDVTSSCGLGSGYGMIRGDILLNHESHTAIYIGDGRLVHARSSEGNSMPGDQSGNEIRTQSYWNYPWDCVLRFSSNDEASDSDIESVVSDDISSVTYSTNNTNYPEIIKYGDVGDEVADMQKKLNTLGYNCGTADGEFGKNTLNAVKKFQEQKSLEVDGEAGPLTLAALDQYYVKFTGDTSATKDSDNALTDETSTDDAPIEKSSDDYTLKIGDEVYFTGDKQYIGANALMSFKCTMGKAKVTDVRLGTKHPIRIIFVRGGGSSVNGWVDVDTIMKV